MDNRTIVSKIDAAITILSDIKKAAEEGLFCWNVNNIVRECRNLRAFSDQLWADWLTAAAAEAEMSESVHSELR